MLGYQTQTEALKSWETTKKVLSEIAAKHAQKPVRASEILARAREELIRQSVRVDEAVLAGALWELLREKELSHTDSLYVQRTAETPKSNNGLGHC